MTKRDKADFEMKGTAEESKRNSWARVIFAGQTGSKESASISISNIKTSVVFSRPLRIEVIRDEGERSVANKMARELRDKVKDDMRSGCKL